MPNNVRLGVSAPGAKQATGEIKSLRDAFERLQKGGSKGFAIGAGAAITTKAFNLAGAAIHEVTDFLGDSTQAFIDDEASQAKLRTSLRANVASWNGNTSAIEEVLQARIRLGFQDDEQRDSLSKLVAAYGDVNKALEVQREAMDLARFSGVDLATATDTLVKVHAGNYRALKALGIQTSTVTNETEALAAVQKVAAGQAEDYTTTLQGRLTVAEVKSAEASEHFGKSLAHVLVPAQELGAGVLDFIGRGIDNMGQDFDDTTKAIEHFRSQGIEPTIAQIEEYKKAIHGGHIEHLGMVAALKVGQRVVDEAAAGFGRLGETEAQAAHRTHELGRAFDVLSDSVQTQIDKLESLDRAARAEEAIKALEKWKKETGKLTAEQQDLYDQLLRNYKLAKAFAGLTYKGVVYTGANPMGTHRASGGPVTAGKAYRVGEQGEETFVPETNGTIIPHGATSSMPSASGSVTLSINVSGVAMMTPGTTDQLARYLEPIITRTLQKRGHIARAGAF